MTAQWHNRDRTRTGKPESGSGTLRPSTRCPLIVYQQNGLSLQILSDEAVVTWVSRADWVVWISSKKVTIPIACRTHDIL
jgi:hypothetical protein